MSLIGLFSYVRRIVHNVVCIFLALTQLLSALRHAALTTRFATRRRLHTWPPILPHCDPSVPAEVQIEASDIEVGVRLAQ